ncbi:hypothetical protein GCM10010341_49530 [Streptomyces noursei]|nr:hypothetical protein GCM10010341_49530 [Streptomyces noursei]
MPAEAGAAVLHTVSAAPAAARAASPRRVQRVVRDPCMKVVSCPTARAARLASTGEPARYPTGYGDQATARARSRALQQNMGPIDLWEKSERV